MLLNIELKFSYLPSFKCMLIGLTLAAFIPSVSAQSVTFFDSYQLSLTNNSNVLSKQSLLEADSEVLEQSWSRVLPKVTVNATKGKGQYSTEFIQDVDESFTRSTIRVLQPIISVAKFKDISKSELSVLRSEAEFEVEKYGVSLETLQAYLDALRLKKEAGIFKQEAQDHLLRIDRLEALLRRGMATKVDLLETRSRYDESRAESIQADNRYQVALNKLAQLVGLDSVSVSPLDETIWQQSKSIIDSKLDWENLSVHHSFTIKMAQLRLEESRSDVEVKQAAFWPELTLSAEHGYSDSYENSIKKNTKLQLDLSMSLYEGGQTRSVVRAAKSRERSNAHFLADRKRFMAQKTKEVLTNIKGSYENILAYRTLLASSQAYLESAEKGLSYGVRGLYDILEAKNRLYKAQKRLNNEIYSNLRSQLDLMFLTSRFGEDELSAFLNSNLSGYMASIE